MTENILLKLEEKVMALLTELDDLRQELQRVRQENTFLKADKVNYAQKLQGLISILEAVDMVGEAMPALETVFTPNRMEEAEAV